MMQKSTDDRIDFHNFNLSLSKPVSPIRNDNGFKSFKHIYKAYHSIPKSHQESIPMLNGKNCKHIEVKSDNRRHPHIRKLHQPVK